MCNEGENICFVIIVGLKSCENGAAALMMRGAGKRRHFGDEF